ncbi:MULTISPECIES: PspC domain-containing protein [unclassified Legionella]|uniref:PspC domain-containing protein n=1 Tax=unclassified Legionella TaxID=2622702 RepID=UPI001056C982|nr:MULTISPECIES: PspC domain-containing protein [unclassified Legionella]MDI9818081.1 PspC domain-containing protein [Legionella sp. PL877]
MTGTQQPPKRLRRSRKERMIAGICGGLAEYFNIDPTWMRLLFIVLLLLGGSTILVYLVMWLVVPLEPLESGTKDIDHRP